MSRWIYKLAVGVVLAFLFIGTAPSMLCAQEDGFGLHGANDQVISDLASLGLPENSTLIEVSDRSPFQVAGHHPSSTSSDSRQWHLLPDGLLWDPYLAGPHESRMSLVIHQRTDDHQGYFWDSTLGGRVGLLRYGTDGSRGAQGWQWDLEGGVITRLNLEEAEDVESMDFRFGTLITMADGPWSAKFGYFHISSHVGDEYLLRNPTHVRVNYVTESLITGVSYQKSDALRLYGEAALAVKASGGAKPWQFQTGAEFIPPVTVAKKGGPFAAMNIDIREAVGFHPTFTLQTGWQWQGQQSGRRFRAGFQYLNGYTPQFSFFEDKEQSIGTGIWFDY
ncbi:DUF1207 domain-containing protein [Neorhodopirellula lusitana]|uniref:DUF1207 domain-containing protein n=1 Tax=Neorhodopirellula lusitana TaxID=445327 RepID=UPI0024B87519|nr:DUF1207 domain-containing protein [Neorhodopirellula lusitana]